MSLVLKAYDAALDDGAVLVKRCGYLEMDIQEQDKKKAKNKQSRARNGKDKVKPKPKSVTCTEWYSPMSNEAKVSQCQL
ncbi:hypothetical protein Tco_0245511 [Tanacetum coccineum]